MDELIPNLREERVRGAVKSLLIYSMLVILVPLGSMFLLKAFFFEGIFHCFISFCACLACCPSIPYPHLSAILGFPTNDALTYSAVVAIILVHVVVILWVFTAAGSDDEKKKQKTTIEKLD